MTDRWTLGSATAVGVGLGAALAASMGPLGFVVGLTAMLGSVLIGREVRRRR